MGCQNPRNFPPQPTCPAGYECNLIFEREDVGGIYHVNRWYRKPNDFSIDDLRNHRQAFLRVSRLDMA
jgi:hypothetical protein